MNAKVNLDKATPQSGYTPCACRDCFDVSISSDVRHPELCLLCKDAGCEPNAATECDRTDAYDDDGIVYPEPTCRCGTDPVTHWDACPLR